MAALTMKQAKASFEDACHYIAKGRHLIPDFAKLKERILHINYLPKTLTYGEYAGQLAQDLRVDKNEVKFVNQIVDKYKLKMRFSKKKYFELYK